MIVVYRYLADQETEDGHDYSFDGVIIFDRMIHSTEDYRIFKQKIFEDVSRQMNEFPDDIDSEDMDIHYLLVKDFSIINIVRDGAESEAFGSNTGSGATLSEFGISENLMPIENL